MRTQAWEAGRQEGIGKRKGPEAEGRRSWSGVWRERGTAAERSSVGGLRLLLRRTGSVLDQFPWESNLPGQVLYVSPPRLGPCQRPSAGGMLEQRCRRKQAGRPPLSSSAFLHASPSSHLHTDNPAPGGGMNVNGESPPLRPGPGQPLEPGCGWQP